MFANIQKPRSGSQTEGQIHLNTLLIQLKKSDRARQPKQFSDAFQNLARFLNHDERAPGPGNPFLSQNSLRLVNELIREQKLPSLHSGIQPDNAPWLWGKSVGSLMIAAKIAETKKETVTKLDNLATEFTAIPDPTPEQSQKFGDDFANAQIPYQALLEKFLPPTEREKQRDSLEEDGRKLMTAKLSQLRTHGNNLGLDKEEIDQTEQNILTTERETRKFVNSEEYIQHTLGKFERTIGRLKIGGKALGDATIGAGIVLFAPTTVLPFVITGYIGHRLSTLNVTALKDWKENRLRVRIQKAPTNLEKLSRQQFRTVPQKLHSYLDKLKLRSVKHPDTLPATIPEQTAPSV
jgi:hypothetical protein